MADILDTALVERWSLRVEAALTAKYDIGAIINTAVQEDWHNTIEAVLETPYGAPINAQVDLPYTASVDGELVQEYAITQPVMADCEFPWDRTDPVDAACDCPWNILGHNPVHGQLSMIWNLIADQAPISTTNGVLGIYIGLPL